MEQDDILEFWFREITPKQWFKDGRSLDGTIRDRFGAALEKAKRGELDGWAAAPEGRLALIILLDQFSRNIFRDTAEAFASDAKAQGLTLDGIASGMDRQLAATAERNFFYMPLMHAEDKTLQALSLEKFTEIGPDFLHGGALNAAKKHAAIITRFGRFPHRNKILGRVSTTEEEEFVKSNPGF